MFIFPLYPQCRLYGPTNIKDTEFPITQASKFSIKKYDLRAYVIKWRNSHLILSFAPSKIFCNRNTQISIKELITCNIWITRETNFIISNWTRITKFVQIRNKFWFNKQLNICLNQIQMKLSLLKQHKSSYSFNCNFMSSST